MKNHWITKLLLLVVIFFISTGLKGQGKIKINSYPIGKVGTPSEGLSRWIESEFDLQGQKEKVKEKLLNIQKNFQKAIELIKLENDSIGKALEKMLCDQSLGVLKLPDGIGGETYISGPKGDYSNDTMIIHIDSTKAWICNDLEVFEPEFYILFTILLHEGRHALQAAVATPPGNSATSIAKRKKQESKYELEAYCLEANLLVILKTTLEKLLKNKQTVNIPSRAINEIIKALCPPGPQPPNPKAKELMEKLLKRIKIRIELVNAKKKHHSAIITLCDLFLKGIMDKKTFERDLKFREKAHKAEMDFINNMLYINDLIDKRIKQNNGKESKTLKTSLHRITDFEVSKNGKKLLVGGLLSNNSSAIFAYQDLDNDGFFEQETEKRLFNFFGFEDGINFCRLPDNRLLMFDFTSKLLFQLEDFNGDFLPDFFNPEPLSEPLEMNNIIDIVPTVDPQTIWAFTSNLHAHSINSEDNYLEINDIDEDGFFETINVDTYNSLFKFSPKLSSEHIYEGQDTLILSGNRDAVLEVHQIGRGGTLEKVLAAGTTNEKGELFLLLNTPIFSGQAIRIWDKTYDLYSLDYQVELSTATQNIPKQSDFKIYPNPLSDYVWIELEDLPAEQYIEIQLFDGNGKNLLRTQMTSLRKRLNISGIPPGVYFLRLRSGKFIQTRKLLKLGN